MPQTDEDRAAQEEMLKNPYEGMGRKERRKAERSDRRLEGRMRARENDQKQRNKRT